jgi:quercetin dioxygenase-like cupin family protein
MLKKSLIAATLAAFALGGIALAQQNPPVSPSPVKRNIISKIEMSGTNYEVITAILEIAPGFKAGRHFHPGTVTGHILEGEF